MKAILSGIGHGIALGLLFVLLMLFIWVLIGCAVISIQSGDPIGMAKFVTVAIELIMFQFLIGLYLVIRLSKS
jgi:hypothetical protein